MALTALYDLAAPAKLNLFLHIVGRRADGYHLLQSLFVLIDWCDTLHVERRGDGRLARHDLGDPLPGDDLCLRAARALQQAGGCALGADISITKRVPSGAGMGGGSSDAATTLLALNRLWGLNWPPSRLLPLGLALGADVPFFLRGQNAWVEGVGERITPVVAPEQWLAVVKPSQSIETRALFAHPGVKRDSEAAILEGFRTCDISIGTEKGRLRSPVERPAEETAEEPPEERALTVDRNLFDGHGRNDLQAAAQSICGDVGEAIDWLQRRVGNGRMTGSGSAVFARAGFGEAPVDHALAVLADLPAHWQGRMCRSLAQHPLQGW